jgi:hypothetical protein
VWCVIASLVLLKAECFTVLGEAVASASIRRSVIRASFKIPLIKPIGAVDILC